MFGRRPNGDVRDVVQLNRCEVLEIHFGAFHFPYSHGVFESQSFAQRMVVDVRVVFGDALRVPIPVRSYRQNAFVSGKPNNNYDRDGTFERDVPTDRPPGSAFEQNLTFFFSFLRNSPETDVRLFVFI